MPLLIVLDAFHGRDQISESTDDFNASSNPFQQNVPGDTRDKRHAYRGTRVDAAKVSVIVDEAEMLADLDMRKLASSWDVFVGLDPSNEALSYVLLTTSGSSKAPMSPTPSAKTTLVECSKAAEPR